MWFDKLTILNRVEGKLLIFAPASFVKTSDGQGIFRQLTDCPPAHSEPIRFRSGRGQNSACTEFIEVFELFLEYSAGNEQPVFFIDVLRILSKAMC